MSLLSYLEIPSILIEVDPGIDDALALMVLFAAWKLNLINILAIICSNGNTNLTQTCENTKKIMDANHITENDIPLFSGVATGVVNETPIDLWFGEDGFGDIKPPIESKPRSVLPGYNLASYLKKNKNYDEISYLSLGSLTFLMTFLLQQPEVNFKDIWIMGGNNLGSNHQEWNFFVDPEAVHFILRQSEKIPLILLMFESCESVQPTLGWRRNVLGEINTEIVDLINKAEAFKLEGIPDDHIWYQYDPVLAVAFVYPDAITSLKEISVNITLGNDPNTRSVLVEGDFKVKFVESLFLERYKTILEESAKVLT
nr:inosine-uridine preferring nucleoside hydrolase-like [Onthophagus taurus]